MSELPIDDIVVDGERSRQELRNIPALAASIAEIGLVHPILVTPDNRLVCGERRLAALRYLGRTMVPVTVATNLADALSLLKAERDENEQREDLLPSEAVRQAKRLEPFEREAAKERLAVRSENFSEVKDTDKGRAADKIAAAVDMSRPTLAKAQAVVEAAEAEPERFAPLVNEMDKTGKVDRAYRSLMDVKQKERNAELLAQGPPPLPTGRYRCIVIDPPWPIQKIERDLFPNQTATIDYPTMDISAIEALPVGDLAEPDGCHIYLWVTQKYIPTGLRLFESWGVKYQCALTWVKPSGFTPYSWMYNTEHVLFGRIGSLQLLQMGIKLSFDAPVVRHSQKPDRFYEIASLASPAPRLDMFARLPRDGFTVWGNEINAAVANQ